MPKSITSTLDNALEFLDKLALRHYDVSVSDLNSSIIYGCDCGCGGDFYEENPEYWDSMIEEEDSVDKLLEEVVQATGVEPDALYAALDACLNMSDKPNPDDEWYTEGGGDYNRDLEDYAIYVKEGGPDVIPVLLLLSKIDLEGLDNEAAA